MTRYCIGMVLALGVASSAGAAVVPYLPFTGHLTDSGGNPINDAALVVTFGLFDVETGGTALWSSPYILEVVEGRFVVDIGSDIDAVGTPDPLTPDMFDGPTFLEITVGADSPLTPRLAMGAMAFAMRAAVAEDVNCSGCVDPVDVSFAYAAGDAAGGAATDVACSGCVDAADVSFGYAAGTAPGGDATGLQCTDCITRDEIEDGTIIRDDVQSPVTIYGVSALCGGPGCEGPSNQVRVGLLTTVAQCSTCLCDSGGAEPDYFACSGSCNSSSPQQCPNDFAGYMFP